MFNKMDREDSRNLLLHLQAAHDVIFSHLHELAVGSVERRSPEESLEENIRNIRKRFKANDIRKRFKANMLEEMLRTREAMKAISARSRATKSTKQASTLTVATKAMKATKAKAMKAMKSMTKAKKAKARKAKPRSHEDSREPEPEP